MYWTGKGKNDYDLMELNDKYLNYIYFEKDSDHASNKSDEDFVL